MADTVTETEDAPAELMGSEDTTEVDSETEAKLKEENLFPEADTGGPDSETDTEATGESEISDEAPEEAPKEDLPETEQTAEIETQVAEEPPLVFGKYKDSAEAERAHRELESAFTQGQQEAAEFQRFYQQLQGRPDGQKILAEIQSGQAYREPAPEAQLPSDPEEFLKAFGGSPEGVLDTHFDSRYQRATEPLAQQVEQLSGQVMAVMGHLEKQVAEKTYGAVDEEMKPYLEAVDKELGPNAPAIPLAIKLRMARGDRAMADDTKAASQLEHETKDKEQTDILKKEHRANAIGATVESAERATIVGAKVVDFDGMDADEMRRELVKSGVKVAKRD